MRKTFILALLWIVLISVGRSEQFFKGGITFSPPLAYTAFGLNHDPGDDPFSGDGPGIQLLENGGGGPINDNVGGGAIILRLSIVGFTIGEGKVVTYQKLNPADLRQIMQNELDRANSKARVEPVTLSGFQGGRVNIEKKTSSGTPFQTRFMQTTWLQLDTNRVLKIICISPRKSGLDELEKSIATIKIDKKKLFAPARPPERKVTRDQLQSISSGFIKTNDRVFASFALRCTSGTYFFTSEDIRKPEEIVISLEEAIKQVKQHVNDPQTYSHVLLSINRTVSGGETNLQQLCRFEFIDRHRLRGASEDEIMNTPLKYPIDHAADLITFSIQDLKISREPAGFRKFKDYPINIPLFVVRVEREE
ncbi:MAG: hypothetical protein JWM68_5023 [Verrucomicrobiales bacterium]|nr:hypothetical protein [Verrucomicrobiales bacterium]